MLVCLEKDAVGEAGLGRDGAAGVPDHIAILVQPQHITALAVDEGFIEQQMLAQRAGDLWQFLAADGPDQAF